MNDEGKNVKGKWYLVECCSASLMQNRLG